MAELVLSPLLQVLIDKLATPVLQKLGDQWGFKDSLRNLQQALPRMQAVLEDAEERQLTDKAVRIWLSELKDATDKAQDFLEQFHNKGSLSNPFPSSSYWSESADKVKEVLKTLEMAAAQQSNLDLREKSVAKRRWEGRETAHFVTESETYGREEDKKAIVKLLFTILPQGNASVIAIAGVGGIGKTTVARLAYNSEVVVKHFDLRMWVFVSEDFDVRRIIRAAIESATKARCELLEMDAMQSKLWDIIHKMRYLLVLDDVWNEDHDKWEKLRPLLQCGANGSKIIITTRSRKVAKIMETPNFTYTLGGLSEDGLWSIFKRRAFHLGEEDNFPDLLSIGKEILRKCGGVPLAATTLGSLLRLKREDHEWLFVQNSELWNMDICQQTGILPSLMLSYMQLPPHLRHCFALCSIFPKNYEIKKETLILIWMAEGLVPTTDQTKTPEDIGDEYFNELSWIFFFEEVKDNYGDGTTYKVHDVVLDLARSITRNESVILESEVIPSNLSRIRHLSNIWASAPEVIPESLYEAEHLRTLFLLFSGGGPWEVRPHMFTRFSYLRVLHLSGCTIKLPESVGELQCLKYFNMSHTHIEALPRSVSNLLSLQTLDLSGCYNLQRLPDLNKMKGLRHLEIAGCERLMKLPLGIKYLTQLQTLPLYIVPPTGSRMRMTMRESIDILRDLNLQGELKIKHLENVIRVEEAKSANLINKARLKSLVFCWGSDQTSLSSTPILEASVAHLQERKQIHASEPSTSKEMDANLAEKVLGCLQPHPNLKSLSVVGYPGDLFPHWMLPKLSVVNLMNCKGCVHLPSLSHLTSLKTLQMEGMHKVRNFGQEFYGIFASLEELTIRDFPNLEEWSSVEGKTGFPKLTKFILKKCPKLISLPTIPSLGHLELQGCNPTIFNTIGKLELLFMVVIEEFPELVSLPEEFLGNNHHLEYFKICSCPKLLSLPSGLESIKSLKSLTIRWCQNISFLPKYFKRLTALESLEITECHGLITLADGGLTSLRTLSIENCSNLSMGFMHLTSMEHLNVMYCPTLVALPDDMEHLSALRSLTIISCPSLEALPEGLKHVTALQSLEIRSCTNISYLPEWFENFSSLRSLAISDCPKVSSLPMALKQLTALQHLSIHQCPELETRCRQEEGVDWQKISHVPYRYVSSSSESKNHFPGSSST